MLSFLPLLTLAQTTPTPAPPIPQEIISPQEMRSLPGQLDSTPVFNSNSPEVVQKEGILLSTFPSAGKRVPAAHLDYAFNGRFDIFAHHIASALTPTDLRTMYVGILVNNPGKQPVTIDILRGASYLSQPDAPFIAKPPYQDNNDGKTFAGPGGRVSDEILRGVRTTFPDRVVIPPGASRMLMNMPIPVRSLVPPLNGRSTLMQVRSTGTVYVASLGMFAKTNPDGSEREPNLNEWQALLNTGDVAGPRDKTPTPIDQPKGGVIYGRVAGVAIGSQWNAQVVDPGRTLLTIPKPGQAFSYGLSTLHKGTLGTNQNQSAKIVKRYPDTAYQAHGNYGIEYRLNLPLQNPTGKAQTVAIAVESPLKREDTKQGVRFFNPPKNYTTFRGTVRLRYKNDRGIAETKYIHLVQKSGQQGDPLVTLNLKPNEQRLVQFDYIYPPDATPPQVLTVRTLNETAASVGCKTIVGVGETTVLCPKTAPR